MSLTKEQLMVKRIKIINSWPGMDWPFRVGDILTDDEKLCVRNQDGDPVPAYVWENYPHLFKPLKWYEERLPEEMPEYVKVNIERTCLFIGNVLKVRMWKLNAAGHLYCWVEEDNAKSFPDMFKYEPDTFLPASPEEYLTFKQQSK